MKLTQKHFEFIAMVLWSVPFREDHQIVVEMFANALEKTNPKFKRDLFLKKAGVQQASGQNYWGYPTQGGK